MELDRVNAQGLVLLGAGRMGGAMLEGWLKQGLDPAAVTIIDPNATTAPQGIALNGTLPAAPAVLVIAVKPQMMEGALAALPEFGADTLVLSVAAGVSIARYQAKFPASPIVRAMPNTPAAIGQGITALIGSDRAGDAEMTLAETLLRAVGQTVRLETEAQLDAVTGLSGSGPAYVFHLIEALTEAGIAEGLSPELSLQLARATVAGAGALAMASDTPPATLRENVTSPNGTTYAGLQHLMDPETGLRPLIARTVKAAAERSKELGK